VHEYHPRDGSPPVISGRATDEGVLTNAPVVVLEIEP
jgi:hypothetical protein